MKARALQALAQREHSRSELRAKLLRRRPSVAAHDPAAQADPEDAAREVDAVLDALEAEGLLSQARFVESRVHARAARFGNRRIEQELRQHGLVLDAATAHTLRLSEVERARAVWSRRFGMPPATAADKARQIRFLVARGFGTDTIRQVLRSPNSEDDDIPL